MRPFDLDAVLGIAGDLFESAMEPEHFGQALDAVTQWIDTDLFHLIRWHETAGEYDLSLRSPFLDKTIELYRSYYAAIDPRRPIGATAEVGEVRACHWYFDERFVSRDEFYQDYAAKHHGTRWIMGAPLHRADGDVVYLSFNGFSDRSHYSLRQIAAFRYLMPTLRRAYLLMARAEGLAQRFRAADHALEAWSKGVIALDADGRVLWHNATARGWIGPGRLFALRAGRLQGLGAAAARLRRALVEGRREPSHWVATMGPTSAPGTPQRVALTLTWAPGRPSVPRHFVLMGQTLQTDRGVSAEALRAWFDLTPAQARVAALLSHGMDAQAVSRACVVSMATVRTQIRQILGRCEVSNLQELQRLLAQLPKS